MNQLQTSEYKHGHDQLVHFEGLWMNQRGVIIPEIREKGKLPLYALWILAVKFSLNRKSG